MYHPRLRSVHSPLTPIPPMDQTAFDFSPRSIKRYLQPSSITTATALMSSRACTPLFRDIETPDLSPIEDVSVNQNIVSPNSTIDGIESNTAFSKNDEQITFDFNIDQQVLLNVSNINNRHIDMGAVLDDIGLKHYKELFEREEIDLIAFLLLSDEDLIELGISDRNHREIFVDTIDKLNSKN